MVKVKEENCVWGQDFGRQGSACSQEAFRQQFRRFGYSDSAGPREALSQLHELCCQWLRPEVLSKEQILELLVLEQLLSILPEVVQARVWEYHPRSGEEVVTVLENLETELEGKGQQVGKGNPLFIYELTRGLPAKTGAMSKQEERDL